MCQLSLTSSGDVMRFSTANTTPSLVNTPMAVEPSCSSNRPARAKVGFGRSAPLKTMYVGTGPRLLHHVMYLDRLYSILHLKQATLWAKCVDTSVILAPGKEHSCTVVWLVLGRRETR